VKLISGRKLVVACRGVVNRTRQVVVLPTDLDEHLVKVPLVTGAWPATAQPAGVGLAEFPGPLAVRSGRGAVPVFRLVRFLGPSPEPGVPITEHRALHKPRWYVAVPHAVFGQGEGIRAPR
jgi:hypothetical protein